MEWDHIELMRDASEVVRYDRENVRLYIRGGRLSRFPDMCAPCHWHDDLEWMHILEGKLCYYIDGERITLEQGDALLVNARRMHYGYSFQGQDCRFTCILFHPSLFTGSGALLERDVNPVVNHPDVKYLRLEADSPAGQKAALLLSRIAGLKEEAPEAYEMETVGLLHILWGVLRRDMGPLPPVDGKPHTELDLLRAMITHISRNYGEKLSLLDIAAAGHVSRSWCCQMFRRHLQQTPVDYLNTYRLKTAANLLRRTNQTITEIALCCGFPHLSYFSKRFLEVYGCTPKEYRRRNRSEEGNP